MTIATKTTAEGKLRWNPWRTKSSLRRIRGGLSPAERRSSGAGGQERIFREPRRN